MFIYNVLIPRLQRNLGSCKGNIRGEIRVPCGKRNPTGFGRVRVRVPTTKVGLEMIYIYTHS